MHDFCFSPIYAGFLVFGGFLAYFLTGSTVSLVASLVAAALSGACTYFSMQTWLNNKKKNVPSILVSLAVALGVAGKMAQAVLKGLDEHIVQSVLLVVSAGMALYYLWNLLFFNPKPHTPVPFKKPAKAS